MLKDFIKASTCIVGALMLSLAIAIIPALDVNAETTISPQTNYVALGDSISYGYSATNNEGYTSLFNNYLKTITKYKNLAFTNFSSPGDTTTDLVNKLKDPKVQTVLATADIVTVSIGGDNFIYQ